MKKLLYVALLKVKLTFKDKSALAWMLLAPIIFIVTVSVVFKDNAGDSSNVKYPIDIVNRDNGKYGERLISLLKNNCIFQVSEDNYETAKNNVQSGKFSMGIIIPEGFSKAMLDGDDSGIEILKLQQNENTISFTAMLGIYVEQIKVGTKSGDISANMLYKEKKINETEKDKIKGEVEAVFFKMLGSPKIECVSEKAATNENEKLNKFSQSAIGIFVIFIMFFVTSGAGTILEEKESGTWIRTVSTPTRSFSILGGYILGTFMLGWIQVGILILASRYIFGVSWGNSPLGVIMLFSSFLFSVIGLGSALSSFVKSKVQLSTLSSIIIMPTCLIAGCMWPRELMPGLMLKISDFVPQTWLLKGMTDLISRNSDITSIYVPCIVLLTFTCIFFIAGTVFMSLQKRLL